MMKFLSRDLQEVLEQVEVAQKAFADVMEWAKDKQNTIAKYERPPLNSEAASDYLKKFGVWEQERLIIRVIVDSWEYSISSEGFIAYKVSACGDEPLDLDNACYDGDCMWTTNGSRDLYPDWVVLDLDD